MSPPCKKIPQPKSSSGGDIDLTEWVVQMVGEAPSGGADGDDPNKKRSDAPPVKGDESQDPDKKTGRKRKLPLRNQRKLAQDRIENLERQLQEARQAREDAERARKAADNKAPPSR